MIYSDFKNNFNIHPVKGDLVVFTDSQSIVNSVKNLVQTGKYERFWNPNKGAGIPQTLFENFSPNTEFILESKVKEVINQYEPRATKVKCVVTADQDHNGYICDIYFTPINTLENISVQVLFTRVR